MKKTMLFMLSTVVVFLMISCGPLQSTNTSHDTAKNREQSRITITFDPEKESEIRIALATVDGSDALIEGCTATSIPSRPLKTYTDPETNISVKYIDVNLSESELVGSEVTIKGSITALFIVGDNLRVVDMHGSKSLESIEVFNFGNTLPELNIGGCSALKIFSYGVEAPFTEESFINILNDLPTRTKDNKALFYIYQFTDGGYVVDATSEAVSSELKKACTNAVESKHWIYTSLSVNPAIQQFLRELKIRE